MRRLVTFILLCCALSAAALVPPRDPAKRAAWCQAQVAQQQVLHRNKPASTQAVGTRTLIPRIPVIMVNFADYTLVSSPADVDSMFNAQSWTKDNATGSVRQYFYDQSAGQYNPQFDIYGPVTLSGGYAYYGANIGSQTSARAGYMVTEACALVDDIVDFSQYDSDNDGNVDLVFVLYAGFGENDPPTTDIIAQSEPLIWPQYWNVVSAGYGTNSRTFDGKNIYACEYTNELDGLYSTATVPVVAGIGTACHEFGHALGLPDLYATTSTALHKTLGAWDVMCMGLYNNDMHTPPCYSAYERFFMGWLTPEILVRADTVRLEALAESNRAYLICENDTHNLRGEQPDSAVFYLLENRQRSGWDIDIPGEGMLLTRIHYEPTKWRYNIVNNTESDMGVDIIEADGIAPASSTAKPNNGYMGKPGDAFPYGADAYEGIADHAITDIALTDGMITFVYRGGVDSTSTPIATGGEALKQMPTATTYMHNGQIFIRTANNTYNIIGITQ